MTRDRTAIISQTFMLLLGFASAALFSSCVFRPEPESSRWGYGGTEYVNPSPTPAPPAGPPEGPPDFPSSNPADTAGNVSQPVTIPPVEPAQSAIPWGIPVEGKPGFIRSPYSPGGGQIDVRGFPPGTEIKDPYNPGKLLLVP